MPAAPGDRGSHGFHRHDRNFSIGPSGPPALAR